MQTPTGLNFKFEASLSSASIKFDPQSMRVESRSKKIVPMPDLNQNTQPPLYCCPVLPLRIPRPPVISRTNSAMTYPEMPPSLRFRTLYVSSHQWHDSGPFIQTHYQTGSHADNYCIHVLHVKTAANGQYTMLPDEEPAATRSRFRHSRHTHQLLLPRSQTPTM